MATCTRHSILSAGNRKAILREQLRILLDHLGLRPAGDPSPSKGVSFRTPKILKSHSLRYDSSFMGNDVPCDLETEQGPVTEVPVQWMMDDAPSPFTADG